MRVTTPLQQLMFSTVRLEAVYPGRVSTATAFCLHHVVDGGLAPFLVTNKHVLAGATEVRFSFTRAASADPADGPLIGNRIQINVANGSGAWIGHPDPGVDIAVMPYGMIQDRLVSDGNRPYFLPISPDLLPKPAHDLLTDAMEDVIFLGYPSGLHDAQTLLPLIRRGVTASPPAIDYQGKGQILIDASVFLGSSGSPVFVWDASSPGWVTGRHAGQPVYLLGVMSSVVRQQSAGRFQTVDIPSGTTPPSEPSANTPYFDQMIDLGICLKTRLIEETIAHCLRHNPSIHATPAWQ